MSTPPSRPQVNVYSLDGSKTSLAKMPDVFRSPIRSDVIHFVHSNIAKNHRQPYGVMSHHGPTSISAGHQNSAHSWGTGRAVSRIPRVGGSGTHRSGQGAIGNMCRGGHMFAPTKIWRKWHRRINKKARRYATASALAASALPGLVEARGHRVDKVPELPLVVADSAQQLTRTKQAVALLKALGAYDDVERVVKGKSLRAGRGKMRGRRFKKRKGPLVVYKKDDGIVRAFRNIPGVDLCCVDRLNLLQLAPGSHCGRLIIWTETAFKALDEVFGTFVEPSAVKKDFILPRYSILSNADISAVINSEAVQNAIRPARENNGTEKTYKKNPFDPANRSVLTQLNPLMEVRA